ncbi:sensor domain-containing diguanylate cyclase [Massilia sp. R798]|uniref:Sensor domain-containing diguanylate cyclase n=2 Tax=Massilia soli TaxID=2792854 RepID=A0ABS7SNW7_9BURK|nr:sensor domain-containing diguanylate cyclase [Massilia soli]
MLRTPRIPPRLSSFVTVGVCATVGLTMLAMLALINHYAANYASQEAELRLQQLSWQMRDSLNRVVQQAGSDVSLVSGLSQVRQASDPAEVRSVLDNLQTTFPDYAWIGMTDNRGVIYASTSAMLEQADVSARPWFQSGKEGLRAVDYHPALLLGKLLPKAADPWRFVDVAAPVLGPDGEARGVIGVHLSWAWARRVAANLLTPALKEYGAEILVVRRDGTVLLGPAGMEEKKIATTSLTLAFAGATGALTEDWADGRTYLTGYTRTGDPADPASLEWAVLVRQPEATAMAGWNTLKWQILWISLLLGGALAWLAASLARKLTRPMNQLSRMMETRASGAAPADVAAIPEVYGFREAQVLSKAMRSMLEVERQHTRTLERMNEQLEAKVAERTAELHALAMSDTLTGLPNRRALMHMLPQALKRAVRLRRSCAVLFLDLDGFKGINDNYGHDEGDELLRQVGARIVATVRKTDMVARLAGDEFVVILEMLPTPADAEATALKLLPQLRLPFALANNVVSVGASIGVAVFMPEDPLDMAALLARADQAMYQAKADGKNRISLAPLAREALALA